MEGLNNVTILTPAAISSMKRSELQKLCKKYGLKANGKNTDLQKKLRQYALNSEGGNIDMKDIEMMDIDYNPGIDGSSSRNIYADSASEPATPQTPSAIPLEQQNKIRRSLVDDSPINTKTTFQSEIKGEIIPHENNAITTSNEPLVGDSVSVNAAEQCLSLILYKESIFSNLAKEAREIKEQEELDIKEVENMNIQKLAIVIDDNLKAMKIQNTKQLIKENDMNVIVSPPLNERVKMNKEKEANIFVSPLNSSSKSMPIEPQTPPSKRARFMETEHTSTNLMARFAATPVLKSGVQANSLPESCSESKVKVGLALDENSPFITRETKLNFEIIQNSLLTQEEKSHAEDKENKRNSTDICDEQSKSMETTDVLFSSENDIIASVYKELENRVAQLKALPSPERKKILGTDNVKTGIPMKTPLKKDGWTSLIKQTSSSSINRFTHVHEKVFSKMPSIMTHYAAQKTKKVEGTQNELNRKRKDPDNMQSFKKQKLTHDTQDNKVIKTAKDILEDEVIQSNMKKVHDRNQTNRTKNNIRSSMLVKLTKNKNDSKVKVQPSTKTRFNIQESLKKQLGYVPHKGPVKSIAPNPDEKRKKEREELEKRKQAARNVAQPVLERMRNQRKSEKIEKNSKELLNTQNFKTERVKDLV